VEERLKDNIKEGKKQEKAVSYELLTAKLSSLPLADIC
jgi:hypothetical protein